MPFGLGYTFVGRLLPQDLAGLLVDSQYLPLMWRAVVDRVRIAIETGSERLFGIAGHSRGDEDLIAPHDGRRVGESGDFDAPDDIGPFGGVPLHRRLGAVADAGSGWTVELRPVARPGPAASHHEQGPQKQRSRAPHCVTAFLNLVSRPPCFKVKLAAESNSTSRWYGANSKTVALLGLGANSGCPVA